MAKTRESMWLIPVVRVLVDVAGRSPDEPTESRGCAVINYRVVGRIWLQRG